MNPVLIYMRPLNQRANARVDVRVADGPNADTYGTGAVPWSPGIITRPTLSIELMSPDMDGKVQAGRANFSLALGALASHPDALIYYWTGAAVVIHSTGALEGPGAVPDFWGYVTSAQVDLETKRLNVTAEVSTALIDTNLLTKEFGGGGGADGDAGLRGTLRPVGMGACKNVRVVFFDLTRNIGQIDGYGNTISIDALLEGLASLGPPVANYATYAALAAAIDAKAVPRGRWATCIAEGLIGLGAPPAGIITCHATFGYNSAGAIMRRIMGADHANVPIGQVDIAAFNALDAAVPFPMHFWTDQQRNVKELMEAIAQSCNATPLVTFQNTVSVTRAVIGAPVATLDRSGSIDPRVINWAIGDIAAPYYQIRGRTARPGTVLTDDQVNYNDTLVDQGVFNMLTTYRQGNLVWLADGSQWLYQNATASAGHAPPVGAAPDGNGNVQDAWWFRRRPPSVAADFKYADGTPIEALKPAQAGADPTATHTAAAIYGQGDLALKDYAGPDDLIIALGGGNQVRNSSFDGPTYSVGVLGQLGAGYAPYDNDALASTRWDLVVGRNGGLAQRTSWVSNASTKGIFFSNSGGVNNVGIFRAAQTYVVSWYARATGAALGCQMYMAFNGSPNDFFQALANPPLSNDFQRYAFRMRWLPAGPVDANGFFYTLGANGVSTVTMDDIQVEEGDTLTGYSRGILSGEIRTPDLSPNAVVLGTNVVSSDGTSLTDARAVTALGVAAAIYGQAAAATDPTIQPGSTNDRIQDTRNDNQAPGWYQTYYAYRQIIEFKDGYYLGVPEAPGGAYYGALQTTVDWSNDSGGYVKQRFVLGANGIVGRSWIRVGLASTGWGYWVREYSGVSKPAFGADLLETDGGFAATLANFKTFLGIASGIYNQADAATDHSIEPGADVTKNKTPSIGGSPAFVLQADYNGVVTAIPAARPFAALEGTTDRTTTSNWSIVNVSPSSLAGYITVDNAGSKGTVTLSPGVNALTATLKAILPSGAIATADLVVTKDKAAQPISGGSGSTSGTLAISGSTTSGSYSDMSNEVLVRSDGAGKLKFAFDVTLGGTNLPSANRAGAGKIVYATSSMGSPTDIAGPVTSGSYAPATDSGEISYGEIQLSMPAPNTDYYFRFQGRRASGVQDVTFSGSGSVRQ